MKTTIKRLTMLTAACLAMAAAKAETFAFQSVDAWYRGDYAAAKAALERGIQKEEVESYELRSWYRSTGTFGGIDPQGAASDARHAAEAGSADGAFYYGRCLVSGCGVPFDEAGGAKWMAKAVERAKADLAASNRVADAHGILGDCLLLGWGGLERDARGAMEHFVAVLRSPEAAEHAFYARGAVQKILMSRKDGGYYAPERDKITGEGYAATGDERALAAAWLAEHAADNAATMLTMNMSMPYGGRPFSDEALIAAWRKLADQGDSEAKVNLAFTLLARQEDSPEGMALLEDAARCRAWGARTFLADRLFEGKWKFCKADPVRAAWLLEEAVSDGDVYAAYELALRAAVGAGVERDDEGALKLLHRAAVGGVTDAQKIEARKNPLKALRKKGKERYALRQSKIVEAANIKEGEGR